MVEGILSSLQGLSSTSTAKDTLILRSGQVLPGTVLEVTPENAVVLLNGINVVAELTTPVSQGEKLLLQVVEQLPDGKVLLQKVSPEQVQSELASAPKDLENLVSQLGIKNSKLNETIVRELLQLKVPVTQRTVDLLSAFAVKNNVSAREAPALAWLWARGLPITRESISAMVSLMEGGLNNAKLGELLQALSRNPAESEQAVSANTNGISSSKLLMEANGSMVSDSALGVKASSAAAGSAVMEAVEQLLLTPGEPKGQWAQKLLDALETLGLGHERDILRLLEQAGKQGSKNIQDPNELPSLLKGEEGKTLKAALMEMLKPEGQLSGQNLHPANQIASGVLKDITGFQLLNITGQQDTDGVTTFIPGWLATQDNTIQPFFLKIKEYCGGNASSEQDYQCQVLFFISTKGMGEVMCRLALEKDRLTCSFTVGGEEECRLLDSLLPVLQERMESLPWNAVIYPSKIKGSEEIIQTWYEETFVDQQKSFQGLDAKV